MESVDINAAADLHQLSAHELVQSLQQLVNKERELALKIVDYLYAVEVRAIYAKLGYPSLFEFCRQELRYSEGAAQRRISAMRLVRDVPAAREKISDGGLSLTVAAQAQIYFRKQARENKPLRSEMKLELLEKLNGFSARECERELIKLDPEMARQDRVRIVTEELTELRITVDRAFMEKLERLRGLVSHSHPSAAPKDILEMALDVMLKKKDPSAERGSRPVVRREPVSNGVVAHGSRTRVPSSVRRLVWRRHGGKCSYISPVTGRKCGSRHLLEIDHIIPRALGGQDSPENLQLLCDLHNRLKGASMSD